MTTKEQVIELAKQAGIDDWWESGNERREELDDLLTTFATLVRNAYRAELLAGVGELSDAHDHPEPHTTKWTQLEMDYINRRVAAAVLASRNAALEEAKQKLLAEPVELIAKWKAAEAIESIKESV